MCGIAGYFFWSGSSVTAGDHAFDLRRMVGTLRHRGPDAEGFLERPGVGLGMRRLRVIDLVSGDQPIANRDGTCWIIFNGEIYNYRELRSRLEKKGHAFRTQTDTEVILRLYEEKGVDCVRDLNGMYAFAVYDARQKSLFLARDPLGIKPLFYYRDREKFVFGSEVKAVLEFPGIPPDLDLEATSHFLSFNYLPAPWTMFRGIRQLEGGHSLLLKEGGITAGRFWDVPAAADDSLTEPEVLDKTKMLLRKSVQSQLVADVPVGAFLSGGLDSSALVALIKECRSSPVDTFSVGFEEPSYDETPYARKVAAYFGTRHHEVVLRSSDLPILLERLTTSWDQPLADPAALALLRISEEARRHVTVALSGDGSDEIFMGYPTFQADRYLRWYQRLPKSLREGVIEPLARRLPASDEKFSFDYRARKFIEGSRFHPEKAHHWWRTIYSDGDKARLFRSPYRQAVENTDSFSVYERHFDDAKGLDFTSQCLYADLRVWLAGNNLHKVDSMTMAHSLEARVPYLDQELVDFMMRVPPAIKCKGNQSKVLLKKAMEGLLPAEVLHRRKAGWHLPFAKWFRYDLKDYLIRRFAEPCGAFDEIFDRNEIQRLLAEHFQGRANNAYKIWGLLILWGQTPSFAVGESRGLTPVL